MGWDGVGHCHVVGCDGNNVVMLFDGWEVSRKSPVSGTMIMVCIAVDTFSAPKGGWVGYSSVAHLTHLPLNHAHQSTNS